MPGPQDGQGGRGDEVGARLPMGEELGVAGQPVDCFTWNFKGFREIMRTIDGGERGTVCHI